MNKTISIDDVVKIKRLDAQCGSAMDVWGDQLCVVTHIYPTGSYRLEFLFEDDNRQKEVNDLCIDEFFWTDYSVEKIGYLKK